MRMSLASKSSPFLTSAAPSAMLTTLRPEPEGSSSCNNFEVQ